MLNWFFWWCNCNQESPNRLCMLVNFIILLLCWPSYSFQFFPIATPLQASKTLKRHAQYFPIQFQKTCFNLLWSTFEHTLHPPVLRSLHNSSPSKESHHYFPLMISILTQFLSSNIPSPPSPVRGCFECTECNIIGKCNPGWCCTYSIFPHVNPTRLVMPVLQ